jgi:hypothetical protein
MCATIDDVLPQTQTARNMLRREKKICLFKLVYLFLRKEELLFFIPVFCPFYKQGDIA